MEVEWRAKGEFLHTDSMILTENSVHFLFAALFMSCQLDEHNVHNIIIMLFKWLKKNASGICSLGHGWK